MFERLTYIASDMSWFDASDLVGFLISRGLQLDVWKFLSQFPLIGWQWSDKQSLDLEIYRCGLNNSLEFGHFLLGLR